MAASKSTRGLIASTHLTGQAAVRILDDARRLAAGEGFDRSLSGKTVVNLFLEPSTRTRVSFEMAARRLGADVVTLTGGEASVRKGESLEDTLRTVEAIGADAVVLRHPAAGAASRAASCLRVPVVNAGDGSNDHPTQALVDAYTLRQHFGRVEGLRVVILGDLRHGRGAHANTHLLRALGASVTLAAPPWLRPREVPAGVRVVGDPEAALSGCDAVLLQRLQSERRGRLMVPVKRRFRRSVGLTSERARRMPPHAVVLHPGPLNRGSEVDDEVVDGPRSLVLAQAGCTVPVRMAVLRWVFSAPARDPLSAARGPADLRAP
jgi:aspartate carbamoyltransferase catalytic subunit